MEIILKYTLKKIQEQTSQIPFLNKGGCCHFAKLLAKELESRNINYNVVLSDNYLDLYSIKSMIKNKINFCFPVNHVYLKIGTKFINQDIFINDKFKSFKLTYKDLKFYSNHSDWNSLFNRKKYHPILSKIIADQFKIYDKLKNG